MHPVAYAIMGSVLGISYVEVLYIMVKRGRVATYVSMPLRITFFALALATFMQDLVTSMWVVGGFFVGFILDLLVRGWVINGLSELSGTDP